MSNPTYNLYIGDCISLAESLCIKYEETADAMNSELEAGGVEVDLERPITWKYYVNLSGEYHSADFPMYVISADTQEEILFSKETLKHHPTTRSLYAVGSVHYNALCKRYPLQELLIEGIINPTDIYQAVDAPNYTILNWNHGLVEAQEENLIYKLQGFVNDVADRWFINDYKHTDDLYTATQYGILKLFCVNEIINVRKENCKTARAHSYHIWEYLGSRGRLDEFRNALTLKQSLWLYRNIDWIYANLGKQSTFEALVQNLFTDVGVRIFTYILKHDHRYIDSSFKPSVFVGRKSLNFVDNSSGLIDTNISELTSKLGRAIGSDNFWFDEDVAQTIEAVQRGPNSKFQTKIVEALVEYPKPASEISKADVQMRHWLHLAASGVYTNYVYITETKTGTKLRLTPLEAYVLNIYLFSIYMEKPLTSIPTMMALKVLKDVKPSVDEIMPLITAMGPSREFIEFLLDLLPERGVINSAETFNGYIESLVHALKTIKFMGDVQESTHLKNGVEMMYLTLFDSFEYDLGINLDTFLDELDINFATFRPSEARDLSHKIITAATGMHIGSEGSENAIQSAMISIMRRLSSYNVQYITNVDDAAPISAKRPTIRITSVERLVENKTEHLETGYRYDQITKGIIHEPKLFIDNNPFVNTGTRHLRHSWLPVVEYKVPTKVDKVVTFELPRTTIICRKE